MNMKRIKWIPGTQLLQKIGLVLVGISLMLISVFAPASAATQPTMVVTAVNPGLRVTVQISNLPQNTDFTVTEGAGGTAGIGGGLVAHFNSGVGGSQVITFEIFADFRGATSVDIRIDSGTGFSAWANFNATTSTISATATAAPTAASSSGSTASSPISSSGAFLRILHVEQGGIVIVEAGRFPLNTEYTVSIASGGTQGLGGYLVAHMPVGSSDASYATFEIPALLRDSATLDLRLEANGFLLIKTFSNTNF